MTSSRSLSVFCHSGVVGTDDPRSANAVAVELVREALEAVRAG